MVEPITDVTTGPSEPYPRLFLRFLRFGFLAWGGPVAQIAMIRQELVDEEQWISSERFNRVLAVYQVLPGPEAHELCVYFGMIARGRIGGLVGGLGFMLPGFMMMFALSWFYVTYGLTIPLFAAVFYGFQPAVAALIIRAVHRIGQHIITNRWLLGIALLAAVSEALNVHFAISLILAGVISELYARRWYVPAIALGIALLAGAVISSLAGISPTLVAAGTPTVSLSSPSTLLLFGSGLRSGLLTFGGAYTVIPFLQRDAVVVGQWMTNLQFLDGLALSGILPAPLVIFSTFVGYLGGGPVGALAMTAGIFLPAFAFTLIGHTYLEKMTENKALHTFLDGVTAGVVGLIATTSITLLSAAVKDVPTATIFALALLTLYLWKAKAAVLGVVLGAGVVGLLLFQG